MENRHAVLLVRVSTEIQEFDAQIIDLEDFAKKKGYQHFKIIQTKESGLISLDQRSGTNDMFNFIKENPEYNTVFATEISRLARRQSTLHVIKDWLVKNKVQLFLKDTDFKLLNEKNKLTTEGEMMFSLFGIFAETEITQKKMRFSREKKRLMAMGLSISGKLLFGYQRELTETKQNKLVHHEYNADIVRKIYNWYLNGIEGEKEVSINRIYLKCIELNYPKYTHSKRNINKLLKEEAYTGYKITNNKWKNPMYKFDDTEEQYHSSSNEIYYGDPIISRETFDAVQLKLKQKNTTVDKSIKHVTLLAKLLVCPSCGKSFLGDYRIKEGLIKHTYRCGSRSVPLKCKNTQAFSMSMLDGAIWTLIKSDLELLAKQIVENDPKEESIRQKHALENLEFKEKELKERVKKESQRYDVFINNPDSVEEGFFKKFEVKIKNLNDSIKQLKNEKAKIETAQSIRNEELNDIEFVINSNLTNIESSKLLLKKYINIFVKNIQVLLHGNRFTIISIEFNVHGNNYLQKTNQGNAIFHEAHYNNKTFVILDKKQTLKIRAVKTNINIDVVDEKTIKALRWELPIDSIFEPRTESHINMGVLKEFIELNYNKLKVY
jgi:DNA invertase Pin-like site-specific DNA recombinase